MIIFQFFCLWKLIDSVIQSAPMMMTADLQSSVPLSLDVLFNWLFLISLQLRLNEIFPKGTFKALHDIHTITIIHPTHNEIDQDNNN